MKERRSISGGETNRQADVFAQKQGFTNADKAELAGIKTGKQN